MWSLSSPGFSVAGFALPFIIRFPDSNIPSEYRVVGFEHLASQFPEAKFWGGEHVTAPLLILYICATSMSVCIYYVHALE